MERDNYGFPLLKYRVAGNAFLYRQVRSMVGTMLDCALIGEDSTMFQERLEAKDRKKALKTAPSDGLYLYRISYDEKEYLWFEEVSTMDNITLSFLSLLIERKPVSKKIIF